MKKKRPNILFIMTDQLRFDYLSCSGADFIDTPSIDRISQMGVRFTNCYTNTPICAPARIGMATGLLPVRMGSLNNNSYLPFGILTYYQRLRDYGYHVGCIGKLDLAKPEKYNGKNGNRPCLYSFGFTEPFECEGKMHAGLSPDPMGPYGYYLDEHGLYDKFHEDYINRAKKGFIIGVSHDSVLPTEYFEDLYIGRKSVEWIKGSLEEYPWHMFVSFVGPHDPYDPPSDYAEKHKDAPVPDAVMDEMNGKPNWVKKRCRKASADEIKHIRRQYCASIKLIDDQIGMILDALEEKGLMDNTYIIFASDHGDMMGDHGLYQKHVAYDPSIRVPLILAGPGIQKSKVSNALIELIDINPTICEIAQIPKQENIDGMSFTGLLFNREDSSHRQNIVTGMHNYRCIRDESYKLIVNFNDIAELYDMENDPDELNNIADEKPDIVRELSLVMNNRYLEGKWMRAFPR